MGIYTPGMVYVEQVCPFEGRTIESIIFGSHGIIMIFILGTFPPVKKAPEKTALMILKTESQIVCKGNQFLVMCKRDHDRQ